MGEPFRLMFSAGMGNLVFLAVSCATTQFLAFWQGPLVTFARLYAVRPN